MTSAIRRLSAVLFVLFLTSLTVTLASTTGINGFSGNPATTSGLDCNQCHSGGAIPVTTMSGPTSVLPNTVSTYQLVITGGQAGGLGSAGGGLDVSATGGTLISIEADTQLLFGELVHSTPRQVQFGQSSVSWNFRWQAPATPGVVTLYGAGNSVNNGQGNNGDAADTTTLVITVMGASQGVGEASSEMLAPLLVTARDTATGEMDITFDSPCEATDNNIYYGDMALVSSHTWSGEVCGIGIAGSFPGFDPGSGSYFFVVVGNKSSDEGSYGQELDAGGAENERADFALNSCSVTQDLSNTCAP